MAKVSIIIPCFNEQATIRLLLTAIYNQTYPRDEIEVVIADGMSTDNTRSEIDSFRGQHPDLDIKVIDNIKRNIPSGLNRAIDNSEGEFIVRLDAHSVPVDHYVAACVKSLEDGLGDNVGGIWQIEPAGKSWVPRSIALAASHPLGVGDANYRVGGKPQEVDTVPFGSFRRNLIGKIGPFDETLLTNEDYEFNVRVRKAGGVIWMDPNISSVYYARPTFWALARQYWRYGYWKFKMLVRYPETFRWRQLAGAFVLTWIILGVFSIWLPIARLLLVVEFVIYIGALILSGVHTAIIRKSVPLFLGIPIAIATMHFAWGTAFLWSAGEYIGGRLLNRSS